MELFLAAADVVEAMQQSGSLESAGGVLSIAGGIGVALAVLAGLWVMGARWARSAASGGEEEDTYTRGARVENEQGFYGPFGPDPSEFTDRRNRSNY